MNTNKREADHMTGAEQERLQASGKVWRVSSLWVERTLNGWSSHVSKMWLCEREVHILETFFWICY